MTCKAVSSCIEQPIDTKYHIMDRNQLYLLEKVKSTVDLGAHFDSNLTFSDHISEQNNTAYSVLGIIKRIFVYMDEHTFIAMVHPHIEYANSVWCPFKLGNIKEIEKIQKRATKLIIKLKNKPQRDRLIHLKLPTLKYRHLQGGMTEVFKKPIIYMMKQFLHIFLPTQRANTRGNNYKLVNHSFHYDLH